MADGADESCGVDVPGLDELPDVPALLDGAPEAVPVPEVDPLLARLLEPELPVEDVSAPLGAGAVFAELEVDGVELPDVPALPLPARTEFPVPDVSDDAFGVLLDEPEPALPVGAPDMVAVGEPVGDDEPLDDVDVPEDVVPDEDDLLPPEPLSPQALSARRPAIAAVAARRRLLILYSLRAIS